MKIRVKTVQQMIKEFGEDPTQKGFPYVDYGWANEIEELAESNDRCLSVQHILQKSQRLPMFSTATAPSKTYLIDSGTVRPYLISEEAVLGEIEEDE